MQKGKKKTGAKPDPAARRKCARADGRNCSIWNARSGAFYSGIFFFYVDALGHARVYIYVKACAHTEVCSYMYNVLRQRSLFSRAL